MFFFVDMVDGLYCRFGMGIFQFKWDKRKGFMKSKVFRIRNGFLVLFRRYEIVSRVFVNLQRLFCELVFFMYRMCVLNSDVDMQFRIQIFNLVYEYQGYL